MGSLTGERFNSADRSGKKGKDFGRFPESTKGCIRPGYRGNRLERGSRATSKNGTERSGDSGGKRRGSFICRGETEKSARGKGGNEDYEMGSCVLSKDDFSEKSLRGKPLFRGGGPTTAHGSGRLLCRVRKERETVNSGSGKGNFSAGRKKIKVDGFVGRGDSKLAGPSTGVGIRGQRQNYVGLGRKH